MDHGPKVKSCQLSAAKKKAKRQRAKERAKEKKRLGLGLDPNKFSIAVQSCSLAIN
jgi:hypothetical protein